MVSDGVIEILYVVFSYYCFGGLVNNLEDGLFTIYLYGSKCYLFLFSKYPKLLIFLGEWFVNSLILGEWFLIESLYLGDIVLMEVGLCTTLDFGGCFINL